MNKDCEDCIFASYWQDNSASNFECTKYEQLEKTDPYRTTLGLLLTHNWMLAAKWCKFYQVTGV